MRIALLTTLLLAGGFRPVLAQDFSAVDALIQDSLVQIGGGAVLLVIHDGAVVYRKAYGTYTPETAVPIASGTKWLSGAVIGSLLSDGILTLDDSLAQFFPDLEGLKRTITVRQLFSHTSGLPGGSGLMAPFCVSNPLSTLTACAERILDLDLNGPPGEGLVYGGASMHVGGRVAEIVTGQPWVDLFAERIAAPLGMTQTEYNLARNPRIAGGATSSVDDYGAFLQMLLADGTYEGQRVLAPEAIEAMLADQTRGAPILESPFEPYTVRYPTQLAPVDSIRYGIGAWREQVRPDGTLRVASSPGAFGFSPWIDFEADVAGVLLVHDQLDDVVGTYLELQQRVRTAVAASVSTAPVPRNSGLVLRSPFPNPFRQRAILPYILPAGSEVEIAVFDLVSRRVAVLVQGRQAAGEHRVRFDAQGLAPGVYRVVLRAGEERVSRSIVVMN